MSYSTPWDLSRPAGSTPARNIDDEIRLLRSQLDERLREIVVDPAGDPWVLKTGPTTGSTQTLMIPFNMFLSDLKLSGNAINDDGFIVAHAGNGSTSAVYSAPVQVAPGCTVTKVEYLVDKGVASGVVCRFKKKAFANSPGGATEIDSVTQSGVGAIITSSANLTEVINSNFTYYLSIHGIGIDAQIYEILGARVTYITPA